MIPAALPIKLATRQARPAAGRLRARPRPGVSLTADTSRAAARSPGQSPVPPLVKAAMAGRRRPGPGGRAPRPRREPVAWQAPPGPGNPGHQAGTAIASNTWQKPANRRCILVVDSKHTLESATPKATLHSQPTRQGVEVARAENRTGQFEQTFKGLKSGNPAIELTAPLEALFEWAVEGRRFCPEGYIGLKSDLLNTYFISQGIRGAVVGVSGGVDSSTVLSLLLNCAMSPVCPLQYIVAVACPVVSAGSSGQERASADAITVSTHMISSFTPLRCSAKVELVHLDGTQSFEACRASVDEKFPELSVGLSADGIGFTSGQLVSNVRAPIFYYIAALLTNAGSRAVVCGTMNRDEGAYIGYFGKASDAVCDLQPISDIHKHEVCEVARTLGVPEWAVEREPSGDLYNQLTDIEMMGFSYRSLSLYILLRDAGPEGYSRLAKTCDSASLALFNTIASRIENRHQANFHKYIGGGDSHALHLDVYRREVAGGARQSGTGGPLRLNALFHDSNVSLEARSVKCTYEVHDGDIAVLQHVLDRGEVESIVSSLPVDSREVRVDFHGRRTDGETGSFRSTSFRPDIADEIWRRMSSQSEGDESCLLQSYWDVVRCGDGSVWRPIGLNPLLRFMRYKAGSRGLLPHRDYTLEKGRPFVVDRCSIRTKSLRTVIVYLSENASGATRFIHDPYRYAKRPYCTDSDQCNPFDDDWDDFPRLDQVLKSVLPSHGRVLVFPHELLHDGAALEEASGDKIIMRTDVECVSPPGAAPRLCREMPWLPAYTPWFELGLNLKSLCSRRDVDKAYARRIAAIQNHGGATSKQLSIAHHARSLLRNRLWTEFLRSKAGDESILCHNDTGNVSIDYEKLEKEGGYFEDSSHIGRIEAMSHSDPGLLCTPLAKVQQRLEEALLKRRPRLGKGYVVLLTTCGGAPVHKGHVAMMNAAKKGVELQGYEVIGGYISVGHNAYVRDYKKILCPSTLERIRIAAGHCKETDWLDVDSWEALYNSGAVNFTAVVDHLEEYLCRHLATVSTITVGYVFGWDNRRFVNAFVGSGMCVCVGRGVEYNVTKSATELLQPCLLNPQLFDPNRMIYCALNDSTSSTLIRAAQLRNVTAAGTDLSRLWLSCDERLPSQGLSRKMFLRSDLRKISMQLDEATNSTVSSDHLIRLSASFVELVHTAFNTCVLPGTEVILLSDDDCANDMESPPFLKRGHLNQQPLWQETASGPRFAPYTGIEAASNDASVPLCVIMTLDDQISYKQRAVDVNNCDFCLPNPSSNNVAYLQISRLYGVASFGAENIDTATAHVARSLVPETVGMGLLSLTNQFDAISKRAANYHGGRIVLYDHDMATGGTANRIASEFERRSCIVEGGWFLRRLGQNHDLCDSSDFVIGIGGNGLVVTGTSDARTHRCPYIFPYVDPSLRSFVSPQKAMMFSCLIWSANEMLYSALNEVTREPVRMNLASAHCTHVLSMWNIAQSSPLEDLCRHVFRILSVYENVD